MGWSYKHDFKIKILILQFVLLIFSGCDILNNNSDNLENINETKTFKLKNYDKVYLVNWNNTNNVIYSDEIKITNLKTRSANSDLSQEVINQNAYFNEKDLIKNQIDIRNFEQFSKLSSKNKNRTALNDLKVNDVLYNIDDVKSIWVLNSDQKKDFICKYVGKYCIVWFFPSKKFDVSDLDCENLGKKFDYIYQNEINLLGEHKYTSSIYSNVINSQNKIELFLFDINEDEISGNILGYHNTGDLFFSDYSNECQCIYLDSYYYTFSAEKIFMTLVHEFNHLINYCQLIKGNKFFESENENEWLWYTEMLSMLSEDCFSEYLEIDFFNTPKFRLYEYMAGYGYTISPFDWFDSNSKYITFSYASTYALGTYLARNFGGIDLIHEIATNFYIGKKSIYEALNKLGFKYKLLESKLYFDKILLLEPYILINTEFKNNEDLNIVNKNFDKLYLTLNRKWTSENFPDLSLEAIQIGISIKYNDKTFDFSPQFPSLNDIFLIYPSAYSIYYIDDNVKSFTVEVDDNYKGVYNIFYPTPLD